jgi:mono/diheme cytochrome c family protein
MQVKVVIGTIAFMLVMIILGVAALFEPAELAEKTDALLGRQIEKGAALFSASCVECHGVEGKAQKCVDFAGEEKGCVGLPLNHAPLLCGEPSERLLQVGWESSKAHFINQTIAAGRTGTLMPVWSESFGGPLGDHEVEQLTNFVLNWGEDPALCGEDVVVEIVEWPESWEDLPEGDAANGPDLYQSNGCNACHGDPAGDPALAVVGPWLGNIGNDAGDRVPGQSAEQYIYESILNPDAFIAAECPNGPCAEPSVMRKDYGNVLSEQDMADLIAYYLTLQSE